MLSQWRAARFRPPSRTRRRLRARRSSRRRSRRRQPPPRRSRPRPRLRHAEGGVAVSSLTFGSVQIRARTPSREAPHHLAAGMHASSSRSRSPATVSDGATPPPMPAFGSVRCRTARRRLRRRAAPAGRDLAARKVGRRRRRRAERRRGRDPRHRLSRRPAAPAAPRQPRLEQLDAALLALVPRGARLVGVLAAAHARPGALPAAAARRARGGAAHGGHRPQRGDARVLARGDAAQHAKRRRDLCWSAAGIRSTGASAALRAHQT